MNKKQKILTVVALAVFSVLIALHYVPDYEHSYAPKLKDVRLPVSVLIVFYAGLFSVLEESTTPTKPKKRNYWALGLAVPTVCFLYGTVVMIQHHDYAIATTLGVVAVVCAQMTISGFHGED